MGKRIIRRSGLFIISISLVLELSTLAQVKLKDLPDDHWAAAAIYDLVKLGVTKGYPDATFRGKKYITRYEVAVFLSKLAQAVGAEDLRADIKTLKNQIVDLKKKVGGVVFSGRYDANWRFGNLLATKGSSRGSVGSYRLILISSVDLGEGAILKANLDTLDYGYNVATAGGIFASQLLGIESKLQLDLSPLEFGLDKPLDLKVTYGPGPQLHTDPTNILPSETGLVFLRPYPGIMAETTLWGVEVSGGYLARELTSSGKVNVSQLTGTVSYNFSGVPLVNALKIGLTGDYVAQGIISQANRDLRGKVSFSAPLGEKIQAAGTVGLASSGTKGLLISSTLDLKDPLNSGTAAIIKISRVGSEYIPDQFQNALFTEAGLDYFDRPLTEGTWDIGGIVTQNVADKVKLVGKGDLRLSGDLKYAETTLGRITAQGGILYDLAPHTLLDAAYRIHQDKATADTSDAALLGLQYKF